jgi:hypothetical protein
MAAGASACKEHSGLAGAAPNLAGAGGAAGPAGGGLLAPPEPPYLRETVESPYELQVINFSRILSTPDYTSRGSNFVVVAHSAAVKFNFPIVPNTQEYSGSSGLHWQYKAVGWKGDVITEACLSRADASHWPGSSSVGNDSATCAAIPVGGSLVHHSWYQIATARFDTYVVQNQGLIQVPGSVGVNFQQPDTPIRFGVKGRTYYYVQNHTGPNNADHACRGALCPRPEVDVHTQPFDFIILPTALIQLKVMPETILYLPPGSSSYGEWKVTRTFATKISAGEITELENSSGQNEWLDKTDTTNFELLGYNATTQTRWDKKTATKVGQEAERDAAGVNESQVIFSRRITAGSLNVPGRARSYTNAPFWNDWCWCWCTRSSRYGTSLAADGCS